MSSAPFTTIRPATPDDALAIAEIHLASWQATYPGLIPQAYIDALEVHTMAARWRDRLTEQTQPLIFLAEQAGLPQGFASGGPARKSIPGFQEQRSGELYAIYLHPDILRRGVGSRLVHTVAHALSAQGFTDMYVWVLEQNPSRHFYQRLGGACITSAPIDFAGETLTELAYGWPTLSSLLQEPQA